MPTFEPLPKDAFARRRRTNQPRTVDLTPYEEFLRPLSVGEGGLITLEEGDLPRVVKRRLSVAARERGVAVRWRTAPEGKLRFQLVEPKRKAELLGEPETGLESAPLHTTADHRGRTRRSSSARS